MGVMETVEGGDEGARCYGDLSGTESERDASVE